MPVSHGCPFASFGPTGEVSLLYHVCFARYGPVCEVQMDRQAYNTIYHIHIRGRDIKML